MLFSAIILILFLLLFYISHKNPAVLAQMIKQSTIRIRGYFKEKDWFINDEVEWYGSGVIIDKQDQFYVILTNLHVVGFWELYNSDLATPEIEEYRLEIQTNESNDWIKVNKILVNSKLKDFALVYIKVTNKHPTLNLAQVKPQQGTKVYAMGHPSGLNFTLTSGIISAFRQMESDLGVPYQLIQTDTPINPGNSGGPLIDEKGLLVGIVASKVYKEGIEGLNFAISSQEIITSIGHNEFVEFPLEPAKIGWFVESLKQSTYLIV